MDKRNRPVRRHVSSALPRTGEVAIVWATIKAASDGSCFSERFQAVLPHAHGTAVSVLDWQSSVTRHQKHGYAMCHGVHVNDWCTNQNGNFRFGDRRHMKLP